MTEEWRDVPGWEGLYEVSDQGRIKRVYDLRFGPVNRINIGTIGRCGYRRWQLTSGKSATIVYAHVVVMRAFVGPPPEGLEVNHIDGNKLNNCLANLEYVTKSQNMQHAFDTGLKQPKRGEEHYRAKLTQEQVIRIYVDYHIGAATQNELAGRYGVTQAQIQKITSGKSWTHLDLDSYLPHTQLALPLAVA